MLVILFDKVFVVLHLRVRRMLSVGIILCVNLRFVALYSSLGSLSLVAMTIATVNLLSEVIWDASISRYQFFLYEGIQSSFIIFWIYVMLLRNVGKIIAIITCQPVICVHSHHAVISVMARLYPLLIGYHVSFFFIFLYIIWLGRWTNESLYCLRELTLHIVIMVISLSFTSEAKVIDATRPACKSLLLSNKEALSLRLNRQGKISGDLDRFIQFHKRSKLWIAITEINFAVSQFNGWLLTRDTNIRDSNIIGDSSTNKEIILHWKNYHMYSFREAFNIWIQHHVSLVFWFFIVQKINHLSLIL